jgi:hypothetical protein
MISRGMGVACFGTLAMLCAPAAAQSIAVSLGIRETGTAAPLGANGGTSGGIEFVNMDLAHVPLNGTWRLVVFNFPTVTLTPFAGPTANGIFDVDRGTLEHIRFRNTQGITEPIRIFIDDLHISYDQESALFDFEAQALGTQHVFRRPDFSGTTSGNIIWPNSTEVSNAAARGGSQSLEVKFQFVDDNADRWVRLITFNTPTGPNPTVDFRGTLSFWMMGAVGTGSICYANCDGSTMQPILNVDDFTCFINEFAAASVLPHAAQIDHYANCDGSTTPPVLNVDDFTCFISAFAAGCL